MMEENDDPFFFAINTASASASAANYYFPHHHLQLMLETPDLDDAPRNRSARRKRKRKRERNSSSPGPTRRTSVDHHHDHDHDHDHDDEEETPLSPNNESTEQNSNPKRCRADRPEKTATINPRTAENGGSEANKDSNEEQNNSKQDYIHVRARRGQATDSHSLAERVRREKISERMKLLQNLVPGCNKVMGKALMLDEIINYVQSLQRQVEFLSMKLATVNPLDFCVNSLRPKDVNRARQVPDLPQIYRVENSSAERISGTPLESFATDGTGDKFALDELDPSFCSSISMEFPSLINGFADASQLGNFWEDDLQSVVQMGFFGRSRDAQISSQSFCGPATTDSRKIEL